MHVASSFRLICFATRTELSGLWRTLAWIPGSSKGYMGNHPEHKKKEKTPPGSKAPKREAEGGMVQFGLTVYGYGSKLKH